MKRDSVNRLALALLLLAAALAPVGREDALARGAAPEPAAFEPAPQANSIGVNGFYSVNNARQGSTFQAAVVMEIPRGLHVNSNRPLGKYAIPTTIKISAPKGLRVTPISYPRGAVRSFRFGGSAEERLAVYEGRTIFRFNVTVPPGQQLGVAQVRASVRFQSCSDEVCFPPTTRELTLPIAVVGPNEPSNRINAVYFPSGKRR